MNIRICSPLCLTVERTGHVHNIHERTYDEEKKKKEEREYNVHEC
jgi:hypothetical protein